MFNGTGPIYLLIACEWIETNTIYYDLVFVLVETVLLLLYIQHHCMRIPFYSNMNMQSIVTHMRNQTAKTHPIQSVYHFPLGFSRFIVAVWLHDTIISVLWTISHRYASLFLQDCISSFFIAYFRSIFFFFCFLFFSNAKPHKYSFIPVGLVFRSHGYTLI